MECGLLAISLCLMKKNRLVEKWSGQNQTGQTGGCASVPTVVWAENIVATIRML